MFISFSDNDEPRTVNGAMDMENKDSWRLAMDGEMDVVRKNDTWEFLHFLDGCK